MFSYFLHFRVQLLSSLTASKERQRLALPAPALPKIDTFLANPIFSQRKYIVFFVSLSTECVLLLSPGRPLIGMNLREHCGYFCPVPPTPVLHFMLILVFLWLQFTFWFVHFVYLSHFIAELCILACIPFQCIWSQRESCQLHSPLGTLFSPRVP